MPIGIIVLLCLCVVVSTAFTIRSFDKNLLNLFLKTFSSTFFTLLALFSLMTLIIKNSLLLTETQLLGAFLILLGIIFCLIGDIILGLPSLTELKKNSLPVIVGGASWFAFGHAVYLLALIILFGFSFWSLLISLPLAYIYTFVNMKMGKLDYHGLTFGVFCYSLLEGLSFSVCLVSLISAFSVNALILTIGFTLFYFSDMVLMHNYFGEKKRVVSILCHSTYYPAQILIALSILFII